MRSRLLQDNQATTPLLEEKQQAKDYETPKDTPK